MWDVIMQSWGGTERVLTTFRTHAEAEAFCENMNWMYDDEGYFWDLYIEESL